MRKQNQQFTLRDKNDMRDNIADIQTHMEILNGETGELRDLYKEINKKQDEANKEAVERGKDIVEIKTDVSWLKKSYWVVAGASAGGLIAGLINLLIH